MTSQVFNNGNIKITVDGFGARIWAKYGKVRIYFDADDRRFVDLTDLANGNLDADVQSTNIKTFEFTSDYDFNQRRWRWLKWGRTGYKHLSDCFVIVEVL